ncbi:hypothetical protein BIW11_05855 [Tropilaelaps mercedesae]|uniref:C2H2-type domain-containing protein n=1 Tax=Tropilaelaps mercedesae TaxID=418985 RepID=A0A1V9Y0L3_9ACAR|nr:hypothetical protein BIW11_05855 [Tropilaelaps mercedesae]
MGSRVPVDEATTATGVPDAAEAMDVARAEHVVGAQHQDVAETTGYQEEDETMIGDETELLESATYDASVETGAKGPPSKKPIQCEYCTLRLSNRQSYLKHLGRRHPEKQLDQLCSAVKKWYNCEESGCSVKVRSREELLHHLGKDHEWEIKEVTGTFDTEDEFEIFFQRVQKMYKTRFVSRHGKVNGVKRFYCNREGAVRVKLEDRTRKHIKRGTSKIGTFCTAHAIVSYHTNGQVSIIGSVTHYNHQLEGKYLPLLESEKNFIRYHAQMGMNCREILEILHKTVGELDEDDPLRYVDYKTIRNTLERGKTLEQNRVTESSNASDPGSVQMLGKINNYPRENCTTEATQKKALTEERVSTAFSDIVLEHTAAINGAFDIIQTDAHQWGVKRPEGKVRHRVLRVSDVCPSEVRMGAQCNLTCKLCQCCSHLFKCNCGGATKIGKMCKHIHAVVQFIRDYEAQNSDTKRVVHEVIAEEYPMAQEVEEEHGLLDSYIEGGITVNEAGAILKQEGTVVEEVSYTLQTGINQVSGVNDAQVMPVIKESHQIVDTAIGTVDHETMQGSETIFETYEIIPNGSTITVDNRAGSAVINSATVVMTEQRLNPEYEHFLEQITNGHNQLHQVANPENILQASTIFQQLKMLVIAAETPKIIKG